MAKIILATGQNFLRAYGVIKYLADALVNRNVEVEVFAHIPEDQVFEATGLRFSVHNLEQAWYARVPRLRVWLNRRRVFRAAASQLGPGDALIVHDYTYFGVAARIKSRRPDLPLIHYCTEYFTSEDYPRFRHMLACYERTPDVADLVIDVNSERAAERKRRFNISRPVVVLPNTLPNSQIPERAPPGTLGRLAGVDLPRDMRVLIYAGTAHPFMSIDTVVDAIVRAQGPLFFLAFCRGTRAELADWQTRADDRLGPGRARIVPAVPRRLLLSCLHEAHAGLVYYPHSDEPTTNQLFCAPTKLYEYLAVGLPVVCSANPTLVGLVEDRGLGACSREDSADSLATAINRTLFQSARDLEAMRIRARQFFVDECCYERACGPAIKAVTDLLQSGA